VAAAVAVALENAEEVGEAVAAVVVGPGKGGGAATLRGPKRRTAAIATRVAPAVATRAAVR